MEESAIMARRMLRLEKIGTISTRYPDVKDSAVIPDSVSGSPVGLVEYFADCEPQSGNPSLLGMTISTYYKNAIAGSNTTLSIRWHKPGSAPYSAMTMPRFALIGKVEKMNLGIVDTLKMTECYAKYHPDAVPWLPGNRIHESFWMRLVVKEVYWLGGFGNQAYIGWIPLEAWQGVTEEEIANARLPGEEEQDAESLEL